MIRYVFAAALVGMITGCASTAQWARPGLVVGDEPTQDGLTIALAQCEAWAKNVTGAPMPIQYMPVPAPSIYQTYGTYTSNVYGGEAFQSTTTASGAASSFASGYNTGVAIGGVFTAIAHQNQVDERTSACMRESGWIDVSTPEGKARLIDANAKLSEPSNAKKLHESVASHPPGARTTQPSLEVAAPLEGTAVFFLLAQSEKAPGWNELKLKDGSLWYLPQAALNRNDLTLVTSLQEKDGKGVLRFDFNPAGAKKLADVSQKFQGKFLVLVVGHDVVAVPRIAGAMNQGAMFVVVPTAAQAQAITRDIAGQHP